MADNQELIFNVKMDSAGFQELERKMKELNALSDQNKAQQAIASKMPNGAPAMSGATKEAFDKADSQRRQEVQKMAVEQEKSLQAQKKVYLESLEAARKISNEIKKQKEGTEEHLKLQKELNQAMDNSAKINERIQESSDLVRKGLEANPDNKKPSMKENFSSAATDMGGIKSVALGFAAAAVALLPKLIQQEGARAIVTTATGGAGMQGTIGRELGAMSGDGFIREMAYMGEKSKAMRDARYAQTMSQHADALSPLTTIGAGALGGAGVGAMFGGIGAIPGAVGGAALGLGKVGWNMMSDPRYRAAQLSPYSNAHAEAYKAYQAQEFGENFGKSLQGQTDINPLKNLAVDRMTQNYRSDLGTERQLGFSDTDYLQKGGFQNRANVAGFTGDLAAGAASNILGAGGSTRAARDNSLSVLQAQRGFDLTNASSVMGKISGSAGDSASSEQIFKKLLEEGVRVGLDKSEFREEQRKFSETTANILNGAGVTNADDASKVMQGYSRFMGNDLTGKGMEGAKAAYDDFQSSSAETGGRGGSLQFASLMKDKTFKGLGAGTMGSLMEIPENQVSANNPRIVAAAQANGQDPEEFAKALRKAKRTSTNTELGLSTDALDTMNKEIEGGGMDVGNMSYEDLGKLSPASRKTYQKAMDATGYKAGYKDKQKVAAQMRGFATNGTEGGDQEDFSDQVNLKLNENDTDRYADKTVAAAGAAAQAMLDNFTDFKDEITPATDALGKFTAQIVLLAQAVASAPEADKAKTIAAAQKGAEAAYLQQQNAGKPKR